MNLQRLLVVLGLVCVPFYEIFLKALPYVRSVAPDTRAPKEIIALVFALSIGLLAVFEGSLKPFRNKWLLAIPVYLLFNLIMAPHVDLYMNGVESGDFYFWKPFAKVLCFTFMIVAVASFEFRIEPILKTMAICGAVMAGYVILQKFGFDQFWIVKPPAQWVGMAPDGEIGGNLGQATVVASFLAMIVPIAFYLKKYWMVVLILTAIFFTKSDMAFGAVAFILLICVVRKIPLKFYIPLIFIASFMVTLAVQSPKIQKFFVDHSSGRVTVWQNAIQDIRDGAFNGAKQDFSITGLGLGRFAYLFPDKHKSIFQQAHNEFLEFTYNCGFAGVALLIGGVFYLVANASYGMSAMCFSVLLGFLAFLFLSLGSFPAQLGAHQFYAAVFAGLLSNRSIIGRVKC